MYKKKSHKNITKSKVHVVDTRIKCTYRKSEKLFFIFILFRRWRIHSLEFDLLNIINFMLINFKKNSLLLKYVRKETLRDLPRILFTCTKKSYAFLHPWIDNCLRDRAWIKVKMERGVNKRDARRMRQGGGKLEGE